jgi:hypothetical protein
MTPVIAGGTMAHRQLLEEILARLGRTDIRELALEEFLVTPAPAGDLPTPEQARAASGVSVRLVEPTNPDLRAEWHTGLAAVALCEAAARSGLDQVSGWSFQAAEGR